MTGKVTVKTNRNCSKLEVRIWAEGMRTSDAGCRVSCSLLRCGALGLRRGTPRLYQSFSWVAIRVGAGG